MTKTEGMQTGEMSKRLAVDPPESPQPKSVLRVGETTRDAQAELLKMATDAELKILADLVAKRTAGQPMAWTQCDKCGAVVLSRESFVGKACGNCNWRGTTEGGHRRRMTDAAIGEYHRLRAVAEVAARRQMDIAGLESRNKERAAVGLSLFSMKEFREERDRAFKARSESEMKMGESFAKAERERRAK